MTHAPSIPAFGEAFLNRKPELARLARAVDALCEGHPRWLAMIGQRKIGKTSLLLEWHRTTSAERVRWVRFDLFRESPGPGFLRRWVLRVLDATLGPELGGSLEHTLTDPARYRAALLSCRSLQQLPAALQSWILGVVEGVPNPDWVPLALELPETMARATGVPVIVVIDEFQELLTSRALPGEADVARALRGAWQHHQRVSYVIAGSAQHTIEQLVAHPKSAFFDHFDLVRLSGLPRDEAAELLSRVAGRPLEPEAIDGALRVVGGHPFCLHALGDALVHGAGAVTLREVKEGLQSILFSSNGRLALHYEQSYREIVGHANTAAAILELLCAGPTRLSDVARTTGLATGAVASALSRLGEAVVKGADGRYSLADPVLALWLRWRLPGGSAVPMRVLGDEAERRAAEALVERGFELVYQSRGSRGAFDLLAIRMGRFLGVQVKRAPITSGRPRVDRAERERMVADAEALRVPWILAAAPPEGGVRFFRFAPEAGKGGAFEAVENLPGWVDSGRQSSSALFGG